MRRLGLILLVMITSCGEGPRQPPPLARDLPVSIGNEEWPGRLTRNFPVGTPETVVLETLRSQGFAVDASARTAKASWAKGICNHDVDAAWRTDGAGRITSIDGRYFPTCP